MVDFLPDRPHKGRGAVSNLGSRYEPLDRFAVDDGWGLEEPLRPATVVQSDTSRGVITRNDSPDLSFEQSVNPYRGCEHGCVYCFARPSHAYLGLSPGLDFETRLWAKDEAPRLLERALRKPGYAPKPIVLGANTDPYQPVERERRVTRGVLEVLAAYRHPVAVVTKSALVLRDADLLAAMARDGLASVAVSVTTLDRDLARVMEPRASTPPRRLAAIQGLAEAGVPVSVFASPMIPAVNDHEIERILRAAAQAGATGASMVLLRLPLEIAELFEEWLDAHFPDRKRRVLDLVRQCRGGRLYDSAFGKRMTGTGPYAELLRSRFHRARRAAGLADTRTVGLPPTDLFRRPRDPLYPTPGDQLSLF